MSGEIQDPDEQIAIHEAMQSALSTRGHSVGKSFRYLHEPCKKHAEKPPGEQQWDADGTKRRDPNGYTHACPDCQANFAIVEEK